METVKYDPASPDIEWRLKCGDEGFCIDGTVEISCRGACERDEDCGNGKCEEFEGQYSWNYKTCNCKGKNYGINCENPLPVSVIMFFVGSTLKPNNKVAKFIVGASKDDGKDSNMTKVIPTEKSDNLEKRVQKAWSVEGEND